MLCSVFPFSTLSYLLQKITEIGTSTLLWHALRNNRSFKKIPVTQEHNSRRIIFYKDMPLNFINILFINFLHHLHSFILSLAHIRVREHIYRNFNELSSNIPLLTKDATLFLFSFVSFYLSILRGAVSIPIILRRLQINWYHKISLWC